MQVEPLGLGAAFLVVGGASVAFTIVCCFSSVSETELVLLCDQALLLFAVDDCTEVGV